MWDDWITDKKGILLVAADKGVPIGIAHAYFQTKRIAWLEGVRIHPSYRGRGIAGRLNRHLTQYARKKGAFTARLCTGSSNLRSRRHLTKTGFKLLQRFQRLQCERPLKIAPVGLKRLAKYNPGVWRWISKRPEFDKSYQMYSDGWTWYPLDSKAFAGLSNCRRVLSMGSPRPSSLSLYSREEARITLGFAAGVPSEVTAHGKYFRHLAAARGEKVRASVPKGSRLVQALEKAGFEKAGTILVYEKQLAARRVRKP